MEDKELFQCRRLPGRVDAHQAALLLGYADYHIPILYRARLLKPLGNADGNSIKFFLTYEILQFASDRKWMDEAARLIAKRVRADSRKASGDKRFAITGV